MNERMGTCSAFQFVQVKTVLFFDVLMMAHYLMNVFFI